MVYVLIGHGACGICWKCTALVGCIRCMSHLRDMPQVSFASAQVYELRCIMARSHQKYFTSDGHRMASDRMGSYTILYSIHTHQM